MKGRGQGAGDWGRGNTGIPSPLTPRPPPLVSCSSHRTFWALVLALAAVGAVSQRCFFGLVGEKYRGRVAAVPHLLGPWHGEDVILDDRTYAILETREVLYREYRADPNTPPIDLCIVFSQANRKASHPPEVCYLGSGAHVEKRPPNILLVGHGRRREVVLYWYLAGSALTTNYYAQQGKLIWSGLTGKPAQGALIRFSTPIGDESIDHALERLKSFAHTNLPLLLTRLT